MLQVMQPYIRFIHNCVCFEGYAQNSNGLFIRHDTTLLKVAECEWLIKSLPKNNPSLTSELGKSIPQIILEHIAKGKLKAIDIVSKSPIPAKNNLRMEYTN